MNATQQIETGTEIKFKGYGSPVDQEILSTGDVVFVTGFNTAEGVYNVAKKKGGKPVDSLLPSEFEVVGAKPSVTAKKAAKKAAKEAPPAKPAKAAKVAKKAAKAEKPAKAAKAEKPAKAEKVAKAPKPEKVEEAPPAPVRLSADVKAAIAESGGSLVKAAKALATRSDVTDYTLGGVLAKIQEEGAHEKVKDPVTGEFYTGHTGFGAFCDNYVGVAYRKSLYLIDIYRTCDRFGIKPTEVAKIGWSKFKEALKAFTEESVEEILTLAKEQPFGQFQQSMRDRIVAMGGSTHGNRKTAQVTSFRFVLHNDKAKVMKEAIAKAATELELNPNKLDPMQVGSCLDYIVGQWMQQA